MDLGTGNRGNKVFVLGTLAIFAAALKHRSIPLHSSSLGKGWVHQLNTFLPSAK